MSYFFSIGGTHFNGRIKDTEAYFCPKTTILNFLSLSYQGIEGGRSTPYTPFVFVNAFVLYYQTFNVMDGEILILKKTDLLEIMEGYVKRISSSIQAAKPSGIESNETPKVKRLNSRKICEMLDISMATFERIQNDLPLHRTKTGRIFAYEHDLIVHLFRECPPYFDYTRFKDYITQENLVKHISGQS